MITKMMMMMTRKAARIAMTVAVVSLAVSAFAAFREPSDFFRGYLFSFIFWSDLPLGALALVMIYHLTGGVWGAATRRVLEAFSDTILCVAVFSLPVLAGLHWIYPWMEPATAALPKVLHKRGYLNPLAFSLRTVFYFACWIGLNHFLQKLSGAQGEDADLRARARLRSLSAGGLVLTGFLLSFAGIDWQMSVEPEWRSTIYGMIFGITEAMTAYSLGLAVFGFLASRPGFPHTFTRKALRDLGNILLILVMVWAYLSFMQYLIIWSGNLPHEVTWFQHRTEGGWQWLALLLALFQFAAPFLLLLFRSTKESPARLGALGAFVFAICALNHYWMLMPGFGAPAIGAFGVTLATWLGLGGIWFWVFARRLRSQPRFAVHDPDWESATHGASREA